MCLSRNKVEDAKRAARHRVPNFGIDISATSSQYQSVCSVVHKCRGEELRHDLSTLALQQTRSSNEKTRAGESAGASSRRV